MIDHICPIHLNLISVKEIALGQKSISINHPVRSFTQVDPYNPEGIAWLLISVEASGAPCKLSMAIFEISIGNLDQRTKSAYIFGAICPMEGKAAGLVLPFCNTETMNLHLAEISPAVTAGAHAVLLMDQAGWHTTGKLEVPGNITIPAGMADDLAPDLSFRCNDPL